MTNTANDTTTASALKLARDTYHFERAHSVGRMLERHGRRMCSIGC